MNSLRELYRIGYGPSSSHTLGVGRAVSLFKTKNPSNEYKVVLFGSLAATGVGHGTDRIIKEILAPAKCEIIFDTETEKEHPNTLTISCCRYSGGEDGADSQDSCDFTSETFESLGGGAINTDIETATYPHKSFEEIKNFCEEKKINLAEYVYLHEGEGIREYLRECLAQMQETARKAVRTEGILPGKLKLERRAKSIFDFKDNGILTDEHRLMSAYAIGTAEENADGGKIVTAPTCGSCGVLPSVLLLASEEWGKTDDELINAMAVAGIIGNLYKFNASISGAECGCQAEIGVACSMTAGAAAFLMGFSLTQIENAACMAMEHFLGLTCDPVYGLVQIPCIERNASAAARALCAARLSAINDKPRRIPLDNLIEVMYKTGLDMHQCYRETSCGGLAAQFCSTCKLH
ncbi:MAG: L-serine ammonia-lyase, iron-sulfur-dependent, subunit alpha [Christensenellaceae bacterium]|jgi:L-serine dehydratase|nr:L-serine ammonia-lyase, iron-sulfur-dependent, subunit alpha [Christensenellaceae bacterium]